MKERQRRVAEQIQRFLSERLIHETRDPRIGFTTLTGVEISPDLRSARVYVTVFGQDAAKSHEAIGALNEAAGHFRSELGRGLGLRHIPTLQFIEDESIDRGDRIERLIRTFHEGEDGEK